MSLSWHMLVLLPLLSIALSANPSHHNKIEICDNGIDDDGDLLIDLNDPDCDCPEARPISYIPNPSFEENSCCPSSRSQMNCADTWIQASEATTDYIHTCGWMGWEEFSVPQPFPDGNAIVGFRDGRTGGQNNDGGNPNWKEYTGACLLRPLKKGVKYRFEFWIGFASNQHSPPINVTFFGTQDCSNLPFGIGEEEFGCPSNDPAWKAMGNVRVFGENEWKKVSISVVPPFDVPAIAIGPECFAFEHMNNTYYYFDNLVLASQEEFDFKITPEQHPCADNFSLSIPASQNAHYQWYKDGIALIGEKSSNLMNIKKEGKYTVRVIDDNVCLTLPSYDHIIPKYESVHTETICAGESYFFNKKEIIKEGAYSSVFKNQHSCDSIVNLQLIVQTDEPIAVKRKIFASNSFTSGRYDIKTAGMHRLYLNTSIGCDSIIDLELSFYKIYIPNAFSPNNDGINDHFIVDIDESTVQIDYLNIYNRWGQLMHSSNSSIDSNTPSWDGKSANNPIESGNYAYAIGFSDEYGSTLHLTGSLLLYR